MLQWEGWPARKERHLGHILSDSLLTLAVTYAFLFVPEECQCPDLGVLTKGFTVCLLQCQELLLENPLWASSSHSLTEGLRDEGRPQLAAIRWAGQLYLGTWVGDLSRWLLVPGVSGLPASFPASSHSPLTHFCCSQEGKC